MKTKWITKVIIIHYMGNRTQAKILIEVRFSSNYSHDLQSSIPNRKMLQEINK